MESALDLRLIYFIGGIVAVLILLLVSFVLNARRAARLENTLDELQSQLTRANEQLDDTAKSLDDLYGRRKRGELKVPKGEDETLATEIKKADGTTTTLGDAISELYFKLGESAEEQEKAYANIITEQQALHESVTQIKQMLTGGKTTKTAKRAAPQPSAQPEYASDVDYIDEDTPVALSSDDISTGLSSLSRSLAAVQSGTPAPSANAMGRDPMNPLGMGTPDGASAARSFPRPDGEQSSGPDSESAAPAEPPASASGPSGSESSAAASAASDDSDSAGDAVPAVSQPLADEPADAVELAEPAELQDAAEAAAPEAAAPAAVAPAAELPPLTHAYDLGVEFTNPMSEAALASSYDGPSLEPKVEPVEAKLADGSDFTSDAALGAIAADVPVAPDSGIYLPEGSDLELPSADDDFTAAGDELRFDALSNLTARYAIKQAQEATAAGAIAAGTIAKESKGDAAAAAPESGAQPTLTIDFASGSFDSGAELKITVSGSGTPKSKPSASGKAPVVDMIYDPDYVRKYRAEKPFGINVETLNRAHEFIAAGISLSELSAKTGLSEEELRLLYDVDETGKISESVDFTEHGGLDVAGAAGLSDEELRAHSDQAQLSFAEPHVGSWRESLGEPSGASLGAVQAQDAAGALALSEKAPRKAPLKPEEALDQDERATIETMMQDQPDPFAHVSAPEPEVAPESEELDEKEALVQKLAQSKARRKRKAKARAAAAERAAAEDSAATESVAVASAAVASAEDEEDEHTALERKLKARRKLRKAQRPAPEPVPEMDSEAPAAVEPEAETEADLIARDVLARQRAKANAEEVAPSGDAELDALSATLIAQTERVGLPKVSGGAQVASVAQAIVSALSAEEKELLKSDPNYQQDLARDIAAALAEQTADDQVDLKSIQGTAVPTPAPASAQATTPSGAPRAPMMPFRRRSARRAAATNPAPIGGVEAIGSYDAMEQVSDVPMGFESAPRPLGGPMVRPSADAGHVSGAPSASALLARGPQSSGRGLNAMLSPNPSMGPMGLDPMGAGAMGAGAMGAMGADAAPAMDSKLSQALAQMGEVAGRAGGGAFKAKDLARASINPGLNFSAGTAMNPGMADMLGAPMGMGSIDGPYAGAMGYEDDDPTAVLNEVVNNGLNSVAPLTQEQLDTLNQLQAGLAAPEAPRQHYANYQARNAYGIKR